MKSGEEIAQAGPLPRMPFVVLAATNHQQTAITDPAIEKQIEQFWQQEEAKLTASVPGGKLDVVPSGHDIQTLRPNAVISAVKAVIAGAHATP